MSEEFKIIRAHLKGTTPTMMNNGRKANILDPFCQAISEINRSRKRGQPLSEERQTELFRLDLVGGLYLQMNGHATASEDPLHPSGRPYWPAANIKAMLVSAAKFTSQGKLARGLKVFDCGPLIYEGPILADEIFGIDSMRDIRTVGIGRSKSLRCRAVFFPWEQEFSLLYFPKFTDADQIRSWLEKAGLLVGLSDNRDEYGRFTAECSEAR